MNLEDVFCSKVRVKILKLLYQYGQMNTTAIAQRLHINYEATLRHLELLEKEGIVAGRTSGRAKFFRYASTPKASATNKLIEEWCQL